MISLQPCNGGAGECVPYYLCVNGTINTDGSDLLDIRFGEGEECVDYFEQCCATGDVLPERPPSIPGPGTGTGIGPGPGVGPGPGNVGQQTQSPNQCGYRNAEGVGFRITGNTDGESEYGQWSKSISDYFIQIQHFLRRGIPMDGSNLERRTCCRTSFKCLSMWRFIDQPISCAYR